MINKVTLIPSAKRLIGSLRDIGYSLPSAIADLVDNSIEAGASNVWIDFAFEGADSWVRIADNGRGMTSEVLDEAFRYGSSRTYTDNSLGRFGLGLKTASLSQCKSLTVATRVNQKNAKIEIRRWDLSYLDEEDSWNALQLTIKECRPETTEPLKGSAGTVVFWEQIDRILNYKNPSGWNARERVAKLCRDVEQYLAMVFHRFISGEAKRKIPLSIYINDNLVEPWDPFARVESQTKIIDPQELVTHYEGRSYIISVQPFILPNESSFSSTLAHKAVGGQKKWNRQQGFYIYRGDRMIQSGGWNGLRTFDEHTKLARIALDFSPNADEAFKIDVAKMKVQLPEDIRDELRTIASAVTRMADHAYRKRARILKKTVTGNKNTGNTGCGNTGINDKTPGGQVSGGKINGGVLSDLELAKMVIDVLKEELSEHEELLDKILRKLNLQSKEFANSE